MPTYRKLHAKVTQSFDFNEMPDDFARVLWLLLPLGLDCEGRGIYNPSWIKSKVMPLRDDVTSPQIMDAMQWFVTRKMVITYTVDGRTYFYVPTFKVYQSGTEKEAKSVLPAPPSTQELVSTNSGPTQEEVGMAASASASVNESVNASVQERPNVFAVYEQEIGMLTPGITGKLEVAEKEYPDGWVEDALREAGKYNKRSWAYAETILKRWEKEGRGDKQPKNSKQPIIAPGTPITLTLSDGRTVEATA